jgi:tetratricopeptide (TPR) repeat protein
LGDERGQAMVLNSVGGVYQRQGNFDAAVTAFQQGYDLLVKLGDERGQAMVLNSVGGVYQRQGNFDAAVTAFQQSLDIGEKLKDIRHLAIVNSAYGKALLDQSQPIEAVKKLRRSFEIEEKLRNTQGLRIALPALVRALTMLGQLAEARDVCRRALAVAPQDKRLLQIQEQLEQGRGTDLRTHQISGRVKRLRRQNSGYLYGFITPDGGGENVYFGEDQVEQVLLPQLTEGLAVVAEVEAAARGPRARRVWQAH